MQFYKYQGAGNDFILIEADESAPKDRAALARKLCDRRYGVGGDGVLFLEKSRAADVRMRIFNPDGSEAEMCGNGIRCLAKHAFQRGMTLSEEISIETLAGVKVVSRIRESQGKEMFRVDLGKPELDRTKIPAEGKGRLLKERIGGCKVSALNLGVPHAVVFVEDIDEVDVAEAGRKIRRSKVFPKGVNVNFVHKAGENSFRVRTYERGVEDETAACGTGIAGSAVMAVVLGLADAENPIEVIARGGRLLVEVVRRGGEIEDVFLIGPAEFVFKGEMGV